MVIFKHFMTVVLNEWSLLTTSASLGNLQIPLPHPRLTESDTLGVGPNNLY